MFVVSDFMWLLALVSLVFRKRSPITLLGLGWTSVVVFTAILQQNAKEPGLAWFLESNSLMLCYLLLAHINFVVAKSSDSR